MVVKKKATKTSNRLYRSESDRMIGGVCAGIADYFGVDASLIRILFITITLFGGSGVLLYFILWVVIPLESSSENNVQETMQSNAKEISDTAKRLTKSINQHDRRALSRGWVGLVVIGVGLYFLLVNFGIMSWFPIGRLWPVILIIIGFALFRK
ncbi:MAG: PspC domain-containing protein [Patescibacteria group bacterium]|jgi:phage shock protein PspC (stress-responsive transcriptional regulator)